MALLVGVSNYDETIGLTDLRGPENDIRLLRDVLRQRDDFDIRILADGIQGSPIPTRDAILTALKKLVDDTEQGDFVYIHMSGHGTQQADLNGDESDGKDEVFLPADTARAEPGSGTIPNAIVDEEIGDAVKALRENGVDVWFVLDSCHSGSGLRAGSPRVASRYVDPSALGLSLTDLAESVRVSPFDTPSEEDLPGGYLAFYSAQSSELAREIQIDENDPDSWYGLFTSRLAARLQENTNVSYKQLFQAVLSDLNTGVVPVAARLQTPLWEGSLIDAPVFGGNEVVGIRQFAVDGNQLQAGKLHGLVDNTVVALVAEATSTSDDILGFAQLDKAGAFTANLVAVAEDCVPGSDAPCQRLGNLAADVKFARVASRPLDAATLIAPPADLKSGQLLDASHPLNAALVQAIDAANSEYGTDIRIDQDGAVLAGAHGGALWFGSNIAIGDTPVGLRWAPEDGSLEPLLARISSAEQAAKILGSVAGTPSMLFPSPVEITTELLVSNTSELAPTVPADPVAECGVARQVIELQTDLHPGDTVKQCDVLLFGAIGSVQGPSRDVNRVYIDNQYCVHTDYQLVEGVSKPAIAGPPMEFCSDCPTAAGDVVFSAGSQRVFFVVTDSGTNQEALNLEGQLDNCGPAAVASGTRSANPVVTDFLSDLRGHNATRSTMQSFGLTNIWIERFDLQLLPRKEALSQAGLDTEN
ncbi:MAG: caspase family protein [Paracoccaceae bacterium]